MALRVTPAEVEEIIDTELTDTRITAFITGANALVNDNLDVAGKDIDAATLKEIERWLSAHYIAATIERQALVEKAGPVEQRFSDIFGKYLLSTTYGQTAVSLDPSDTLAEIAQARKPIKFVSIDEG